MLCFLPQLNMVFTTFSSSLKLFDSKSNPYDSSNGIAQVSQDYLLLLTLMKKKSHGTFMKEGCRAYFMSVYLILSNLSQINNVYFSFSLWKMKLHLFAALHITWKYLINDILEQFQEDVLNKRGKFQEKIQHKAEYIGRVRLQEWQGNSGLKMRNLG